MRSHSTKYQLKEKSPEANFILSNTLQALLLFKIQKHSEFSVDLRQSFSHAATVHLARCTRLFLPGQHPRTRAWRLPGVGGAPGRPRRHVLRWPRPCYSRQGARTAAQCRSAPPIAPWLSAWPHARQRTPVHRHRDRQAQDALPAADGPAPPRSVELPPKHRSPARLAPKRTQ